MDFRIADTFTESLARLTGNEQKSVKTTAFDLQVKAGQSGNDYNGESFLVRHACFLGAIDPYGALNTTLKAEINVETWVTLNSNTSRLFEKSENVRITVKVINHMGDEVMKVLRV